MTSVLARLRAARRGRYGRCKSGQAVVFLIMVLVILFFVVLWNFDLHKLVHIKSVSRNGGDAAAVAAARWQGITLNVIGDLNIMHALALSAGDAGSAEAAVNAQARLCYVGPMIAFMVSQQAAKNNGIHQNDEFTAITRRHAARVRDEYTQRTGPNGEMLFPEPYPDAWKEYAAMLELIAGDGVAAGADNVRYYSDYAGGHILLMKEFYEAIAGRNWCWFFYHAPALLQDYRNFFPCWWPPLPGAPHVDYMNSEIYGLGLVKYWTPLDGVIERRELRQIAADRNLDTAITDAGMTNFAVWYCYGNVWDPWSAMADPFPVTGPVLPQYDYAGADAMVRVEPTVTRLTPGSRGAAVKDTITWTAAAKPFGYLNEKDKPNDYGLVLPAFRDARLIPVDTASGSGNGGYDLEWRVHIERHLPRYMAAGPEPSSCFYCRQLETWEDPVFRQSGADWLSTNSWRCTVVEGGSAHGGGSRRGH